MKKTILILFFSFASSFALFAQDAPDDAQQGGKLMERMQQYIQTKLNLSKGESEKFSPIFLRYISESRHTLRQFKDDVPMRQLKIAELRVRFRDQFKQVLDEKRANRVFEHEKEFVRIVQDEIKLRALERRRGGGRIRDLKQSLR